MAELRESAFAVLLWQWGDGVHGLEQEAGGRAALAGARGGGRQVLQRRHGDGAGLVVADVEGEACGPPEGGQTGLDAWLRTPYEEAGEREIVACGEGSKIEVEVGEGLEQGRIFGGEGRGAGKGLGWGPVHVVRSIPGYRTKTS